MKTAASCNIPRAQLDDAEADQTPLRFTWGVWLRQTNLHQGGG